MSDATANNPPSIDDIAQLRALRSVAAECKVEFVLHGGVAFRAALGRSDSFQSLPFDLFALTPFTADIDLLHSGSGKDDKRVLESILRNVPNADCFRWEVRSQSSQEVFRRSPGNAIPARQIALSNKGFDDPASGLPDIAKRWFRFNRNPSFRDSPLAKQNRDLEVFSALLYLQTVFEAGFNKDQAKQPGLVNVNLLFRDIMEDGQIVEALGNSPYLRQRFAYLLVNCLAAATPELRTEIGRYCYIEKFLQWTADRLPMPEALRAYIRGGPDTPLVLSSSAWLDSERTRLPLAAVSWDEKSAKAQFESCAGESGTLSPDQITVMASPQMPLSEGHTPSSETPLGAMEFVHFALPADASLSVYKETDLSILAAIQPSPPAAEQVAGALVKATQMPLAGVGAHLENLFASLAPTRSVQPGAPPAWQIFSVPAIVQRPLRAGDPLRANVLLRVNMMGLLNALARWSGAEAKFFLIARKS